MACRGQHLRQIADFNICSQDAIAHDQLNQNFGILCLKLTHHLDGRIGGIADPEDQLEFGIVLFAVTAEALPYRGIDTFQRLEDGNGWELAFLQRRLVELFALVADETRQGESGEKVEKQTADSSNRAYRFERSSYCERLSE